MAAMIALALASSAHPQDDRPKVDQRRVNAAIDRGARYLLSLQDLAAIEPYQELVLLTLIHAGVDRGSKSFQALVDWAAKCELKRTYNVSLLAMALEALDAPRHQGRIAQCAQFLVDNQCQNGQWDYGSPVSLDGVATPAAGSPGRTEAMPPVAIRRRVKGRETGDNSNTQYAALGIRACGVANCRLPKETLTAALAWWEKCQCGDGGWGYSPKGGAEKAAHGSMTAGAVGGLAIYRSLLGVSRADAKLARGMEWLGQHWTPAVNPKYENERKWQHYWLWAVERAGALCEAGELGGRDWYAEGAEHLLANHRPEGWWGDLWQADRIRDTCFAILFLRRATKPLPPDVPTHDDSHKDKK